MTVYNVPANLPGEVVASYSSAFVRVEEMAQLRSTVETAHGNYAFQAIPDTLYFKDRQMIVVVGGRRSRCWNCKQIGHLAKVYPQKAADAA